jgi:hypothetical protein
MRVVDSILSKRARNNANNPVCMRAIIVEQPSPFSQYLRAAGGMQRHGRIMFFVELAKIKNTWWRYQWFCLVIKTILVPAELGTISSQVSLFLTSMSLIPPRPSGQCQIQLFS